MQIFRVLHALVLIVLVVTTGYGQIHFTATLDAAQAGTLSSASGSGSFTLSDDFTALTYVIAYQGLSGPLSAGGHFHLGAPGQSGAVLRTIASPGAPASGILMGTWKDTDAQPLTMALVESLLTGRIYVNLHTAANQANEIRGQVNLATALHFTADLDGSQEPTPVGTTAGGTGVFVLNPDRTELEYFIVYRELSGPLSAGGHIHAGAPGSTGPVVRVIASGGDPASNGLKGKWRATDSSQPLTWALVDSLIGGRLYVNFHTVANQAGEIRGQLRLRGGIGFVSWLEGNKEVSPVETSGKGVGSFVLNSARTELKYSVTYINLSGPLSAGGHLHVADTGAPGPVVKSIATTGGPASATIFGSWKDSDGTPLTPALVESLLTGRMYVNFHTSANQPGEIRDQLQLTTGIGFTLLMDGDQEPPPVMTQGRGSGSVVLNAERKNIQYSMTYFGLSGSLSAGGHFHVGARGLTGPVVHVITNSGEAIGKTFDEDWSSSDSPNPLTRALVDSLIAGRIYANFHTAAHQAGEIRGQVGFSADVVTGVAEQLSSEVPMASTLAQNYPNPFNPTTTIRFQVASLSRVTLKVFNLLGEQVATLVDDVRAAGTYAVHFDARGLASGPYFYRLMTDAGQVDTKRMVLLK